MPAQHEAGRLAGQPDIGPQQQQQTPDGQPGVPHPVALADHLRLAVASLPATMFIGAGDDSPPLQSGDPLFIGRKIYFFINNMHRVSLMIHGPRSITR